MWSFLAMLRAQRHVRHLNWYSVFSNDSYVFEMIFRCNVRLRTYFLIWWKRFTKNQVRMQNFDLKNHFKNVTNIGNTLYILIFCKIFCKKSTKKIASNLRVQFSVLNSCSGKISAIHWPWSFVKSECAPTFLLIYMV